jgi:hypothetical protein
VRGIWSEYRNLENTYREIWRIEEFGEFSIEEFGEWRNLENFQ